VPGLDVAFELEVEPAFISEFVFVAELPFMVEPVAD
jgi:hypothetical protein